MWDRNNKLIKTELKDLLTKVGCCRFVTELSLNISVYIFQSCIIFCYLYVCSKRWIRCHKALRRLCSQVYSQSVVIFCCRHLTEPVRTCFSRWPRCFRPAHNNVCYIRCYFSGVVYRLLEYCWLMFRDNAVVFHFLMLQFLVAGACIWNSLPQHVTYTPSMLVFWSYLRTDLFYYFLSQYQY